ncbi:MAG: hypothetical protein KatS3mg035_0037 [Bacteroidia bacterium]|nr:MAG: hypothetical protein KatS3mg035_0037 [Bacteroidia bacterium]
MKKIILIEDRSNRQKKLLGKNYAEFEHLVKQNIFKNIQGGKDFDEIKEKFNKHEFNGLLTYDIIMFHRSAFSNEVRNNLLHYLKENKKTVASFSGGISSVELSLDKNFVFLLMNVNLFYDNLLTFLKDDEKNIYKLGFGNQWKINILYDAVEKLYTFLENETSNESQKTYRKPFSIFESNIPNAFIKENYFKQYIGNQMIERKDIEAVIQKIVYDLYQCI